MPRDAPKTKQALTQDLFLTLHAVKRYRERAADHLSMAEARMDLRERIEREGRVVGAHSVDGAHPQDNACFFVRLDPKTLLVCVRNTDAQCRDRGDARFAATTTVVL